MRLTERDHNLLRWINGHGFATARQAARWMQASYQVAQRRLRLMVDHGLLERDRIFHAADLPHRLSTLGVRLCQDRLGRLTTINLGTYRHDSWLVDLALAVTVETSGTFLPERRLRHDLGVNGVGTRGHLPDGILAIDGQKPIAIELELSAKGKKRLQGIINGYTRRRDLEEVWYFVVSSEVRNLLERATMGYRMFRIRDWRPGAR